MLSYARHARVSPVLGQWTTSATAPTQALHHRLDMGEGACDPWVNDATAALPLRRGGGDACTCAAFWE
jgi:hypothetical protein